MAGSVLVDTNVVVAYFRGDTVLQSRFAGTTAVYWLSKPMLEDEARAVLGEVVSQVRSSSDLGA
jgi:hypothetical protein